jgi:hypothetical protein
MRQIDVSKKAIAFAVTAAVVALTPTIAAARGGHGGHHGGHGGHHGGHGFHGGFHRVGQHGGFRVGHFRGLGRFHHVGHFRRGVRGFGVYAYSGYYGCWRWVPTRRGYVRIWVC